MNDASPWAILTLLSAVLSGVALARSIKRLVRTVRSAIEATVELVPEQRVMLPTGGLKTVYLRAPRFTNVSQLRLHLRSAAGEEIPLTRVLYRTTWSGRDVTQAHAQCQLPTAGEYLISASGIPAAARPLALQFGPPRGLALVASILAVVASAILTIGSLVASIILLVGAA